MQAVAVAVEVTDDASIKIQMMQVAAGVVEAVQPSTVGQAGLNQVSQFVVTIGSVCGLRGARTQA